MKTAPKTIYLNINDDEDEMPPLNEIAWDEVTWTADSPATRQSIAYTIREKTTTCAEGAVKEKRTSIEVAMDMARNPVNNIERYVVAAEMLPHIRKYENVDTAALRVLADAVKHYQSRMHAILSIVPNLRDPEKKAIQDIIKRGTQTVYQDNNH